jgi:hypothetical protein
MAYRVYQAPGPMGSDLPIIGDDIAKIGRIIDLYATPCSPDPGVWVLALWHAIPTFAASILKPEAVDISIRHRRGKPRKGKKFKFKASHLFPDAYLQIPVPRWVFFRIYELSQRIGWYFLLADAAENLGINWMSTAYKWAGCSTPTLIYGYHKAVHRAEGSSLTPQSRRFTWEAEASSNMSMTTSSIQPVLPARYRISWQVTFSPYHDLSVSELPITTYVVLDGVQVDVGETHNLPDDQRYASGSIICEADGHPFPIIEIHGAWVNPVKFCYMDGIFRVDAVLDTELQPDP